MYITLVCFMQIRWKNDATTTTPHHWPCYWSKLIFNNVMCLQLLLILLLDVNECSREKQGNETLTSNFTQDSELCGKESVCINTPGSYRCECRPGYEGNPREECFDINECISGTACGINAKCFNVPGSFKCLCPKGFTGDPYKFCESMRFLNTTSIFFQ